MRAVLRGAQGGIALAFAASISTGCGGRSGLGAADVIDGGLGATYPGEGGLLDSPTWGDASGMRPRLRDRQPGSRRGIDRRVSGRADVLYGSVRRYADRPRPMRRMRLGVQRRPAVHGGEVHVDLRGRPASVRQRLRGREHGRRQLRCLWYPVRRRDGVPGERMRLLRRRHAMQRRLLGHRQRSSQLWLVRARVRGGAGLQRRRVHRRLRQR